MIYISSFQKSNSYPGVKLFSVARFKPQGFEHVPVLLFLVATDAEGNKLSPDIGIEKFEEKYKEKIKKEWKAVKNWLDSLTPNEDIALLCWCPYSKRAAAELEKTGQFFCHTYFIYRMLQKNRPDIEVCPDKDRLLKGYGFKDTVTDTDRSLLIYRIYSEKLGEEIILAPDKMASQISEPGIVVYSYSEIAELLGTPTETLKEIHEIKKIMKGEVVEVTHG